jgi:hypothetical protein
MGEGLKLPHLSKKAKVVIVVSVLVLGLITAFLAFPNVLIPNVTITGSTNLTDPTWRVTGIYFTDDLGNHYTATLLNDSVYSITVPNDHDYIVLIAERTIGTPNYYVWKCPYEFVLWNYSPTYSLNVPDYC